jgi:hypothetical protein
MNTKLKKLLVIIVFTLALTSCIPGGGSYSPESPAGFFSGVWHGWVAPLSLVLGLFNDSISVYEVNNTGWFYDLGFYISIIAGFGGIQFFRKKRN